jgi:hypothetical protein
MPRIAGQNEKIRSYFDHRRDVDIRVGGCGIGFWAQLVAL